MIKKSIKYLVIFLLLLFFVLFYFGNNIFQGWTTERKELTEKQIEKFEQDVKNGVEIDLKEYVVKEKKYDNAITNVNKSISNIIEKGFKKVFKYLLKNIDV